MQEEYQARWHKENKPLYLVFVEYGDEKKKIEALWLDNKPVVEGDVVTLWSYDEFRCISNRAVVVDIRERRISGYMYHSALIYKDMFQ